MNRQIMIGFAIALTFCVSQSSQTTTAQADSSGTSDVKLVDPGFEAFKFADAPISGWFSDDAIRQDDQKYARITMKPDPEVFAEGNYSLRIQQLHPRPNNWGQAYLCQAVRLPKKGGNRSFELSMQTRGNLSGPLTVHLYVWDGEFAKVIAQRDAEVKMEWSSAALAFKVPNNYDRFGIWIYLPRQDEAVVWLDDLRLEAKVK